ncbi:MAG: hypothetical protein J6P61_06705 [Erysipelotrichaceae bacterium]|nr:hypothetical protein [Erysipelotrichaceae bacterium]
MIKKAIITLLMALLLVACSSSKKVIQETPLTPDDYEGFEAHYINDDEDVCATMLTLTSEGSFDYLFADGEIYKDFDLYDRYTYKEEESKIYVHSSSGKLDDYVFDIVSWEPSQLVWREEDGDEKTFKMTKLYYLTNQMLEGTYSYTDTDDVYDDNGHVTGQEQLTYTLTFEGSRVTYAQVYEVSKDNNYEESCAYKIYYDQADNQTTIRLLREEGYEEYVLISETEIGEIYDEEEKSYHHIYKK